MRGFAVVFANNTYNRLLEASWLLTNTSWNTFEASRLLTLLMLLAKCTFEASRLLTLLRLLRLLRLLMTLRLLMLLSNITMVILESSMSSLSVMSSLSSLSSLSSVSSREASKVHLASSMSSVSSREASKVFQEVLVSSHDASKSLLYVLFANTTAKPRIYSFIIYYFINLKKFIFIIYIIR
jgi:hypothetical protein